MLGEMRKEVNSDFKNVKQTLSCDIPTLLFEKTTHEGGSHTPKDYFDLT